MNEALSHVIAVALEQALTVSEERIRAICQEEIARLAPQADAWLTPPRAAQAEGVGLKRVRALIAAGAVEVRSRNLNPAGARQQKLEVRLSSVRAALRGEAPKQLVDASSWVSARAARRGA